TSRNMVSVSLSGLEENLEKGIDLFEQLLANARSDKDVYTAMVQDILQERDNAKKNKGTILFRGMGSYGKYGPRNPFNNVMSEDELNKQDVNKLVELIKSLSSYKHRIF